MDAASEAIVATTVTFADKSDPQSGTATLNLAEANLVLAGSETEITEAVLDKGYHENGLLAEMSVWQLPHKRPSQLPPRRARASPPHKDKGVDRQNDPDSRPDAKIPQMMIRPPAVNNRRAKAL